MITIVLSENVIKFLLIAVNLLRQIIFWYVVPYKTILEYCVDYRMSHRPCLSSLLSSTSTKTVIQPYIPFRYHVEIYQLRLTSPIIMFMQTEPKWESLLQTDRLVTYITKYGFPKGWWKIYHLIWITHTVEFRAKLLRGMAYFKLCLTPYRVALVQCHTWLPIYTG